MLPEPWSLLGQALGLREGAVIAVPSEGLVLHRLVLHDPPTADDFGPMSRLRAEKRGISELGRTGLSHFSTPEQAAAMSWKDEHMVARVRIPDDPRIHVARTEEDRPGHHQVWVPIDLLGSLLETAEIVG